MSVADAKAYRNKAEQFRRAARDAASRADWSATGLNAIHASISASDALTSFHLGERSRSKDHGDAAMLLGRLDVADAKERAAQLGRILSVKHLAAYEARELSRKEVEDLMTRMERFVDWALEQVPGG